MNNPKYIIGIDEAGRGPLAGPVYVGVVCVSSDFNFDIFDNLDDSKVLSESVRESIFSQIKDTPAVTVALGRRSAKTVDEIGINPSIQDAINTAVAKVTDGQDADKFKVLLDGGLRAPDRFKNQVSITKGDSKEPAISLASVVAKVSRDRLMKELDGNYQNFSFAEHKGYGTKAHRKNIVEFGPTEIHRQSFLGNIDY